MIAAILITAVLAKPGHILVSQHETTPAVKLLPPELHPAKHIAVHHEHKLSKQAAHDAHLKHIRHLEHIAPKAPKVVYTWTAPTGSGPSASQPSHSGSHGLYSHAYSGSSSHTYTSYHAYKHHTYRAPTATYSSGYHIPGVADSVARCIAFRESTNGQASPNVFQLTKGSGHGYYPGMSLPAQEAAAGQLAASQGVHSAWGKYDGCA